MIDCLIQLLWHAGLELLKQWLRDWGNLLFTAVIAVAAIIQLLFAKQLYELQKSIEAFHRTAYLFCRIRAAWTGTGATRMATRLDAQLSNLSSHGIWIDEMVVVFDGPVSCRPEITHEIEMVLAESQTETRMLSSAPFRDIVGTAPTGPVRFKLQVRFRYSTASVIGTEVSPIYDVTVDQRVVTNFQPL